MGGGIAWACANAGIPARVKDLTWDAVAKAHATVAEYNKRLLKIRKLTPAAANVVGALERSDVSAPAAASKATG